MSENIQDLIKQIESLKGEVQKLTLLIPAMPELLSASKGAIELFDALEPDLEGFNPNEIECIDALKAAISKAEIGAP
jgi:hypothetical protein